MGFEPVPADNLESVDGMFAGSDEERLAAFHRLAEDSSLSSILFARGGHGVLRVLPAIDWELLARRPRIYVGYSDLTPFLLEVTRRLGLAAFHGPMPSVDMARGLTRREETSLLNALKGDLPQTVALPTVFGEGNGARGPLLGGCLSMLVASIGTEFETDFSGSILFWEEVDEPLYRIDRMLTQLKLSGVLDSIAGMIVGDVDLPEAADRRALREVLAGFAHEGSWLVGFGFPAGHCSPNLTLPLGMTAQINAPDKLATLGLKG
jgi:muramoyltetrapeptide carboxypeptidase